MARQVKASEFENAFEYEKAKRQLRRADKVKRSSPVGRRDFTPSKADE